ncbi:MAG: LVIVD repeat-containing protein, partial [Bradyrhizobium sp.]
MTDVMTPTYAHNMRILGHTDQGDGRADGVQIMVHKGYAHIGHIFSRGFSVVDVRDPTKPRPVRYIAAPANTWNLHLQQHEELLLVVHAKDMFAQPELADEKNYYKSKGSFAAAPVQKRDWSAGLAVYDISRPEEPRQIGFMPVEGGGLHRCWYTGGRWAYASALLDGFSDYILVTIDMAEPAKPRLAGKFWLPGMNIAVGETPKWPSEVGRYGLHHAIIDGDTAYCSWRDACLAVVDVSNRAAPKLIVRRSWAPPFGGGTHNALPLPKRELLVVVDETVLDNQEDGEKPIWLFDNRVRSNPISIATFPAPTDQDYLALGGHFGPHNVYENRPNGLISEQLIFATYQNAGLRVYDISNKFRPVEVAACVPPAPAKLVDPRPNRP